MRKRVSSTYLCACVLLLSVLSVPRESAEKVRGAAVSLLAPFWHQLLAFKSPIASDLSSSSDAYDEEMERLRLENALLKEEILHVKGMMQHEVALLSSLKGLNEQIEKARQAMKFRHAHELEKLLEVHLKIVPASIIFRSPASWNSSMWINVGRKTNEELGIQVIAKNSPVLIGTSVLGVVDYVGERQSRVRLITDTGLTPAVRVARGGINQRRLKEKVESVAAVLSQDGGGIEDSMLREEAEHILLRAAAHIPVDAEDMLLAKGEVHGSSMPLWRSQRHLLKGIGFNYDFADGEGPARDLRTGEPLGEDEGIQSVPIVEAGDLLITSGMDGVFPPGLSVAEVTKVHPLQEGDYYYEIDAKPAVGNFDDLSLVFVIPPLGYDPDDRSPPYGWR